MAGTNEALSRAKIDAQLKDQGWDVLDINAVRFEYVLPDKTKADYVLCDRNGRALAVIEAKKAAINPAVAEAQAIASDKQDAVERVPRRASADRSAGRVFAARYFGGVHRHAADPSSGKGRGHLPFHPRPRGRGRIDRHRARPGGGRRMKNVAPNSGSRTCAR
jgi:hypothetical protein